MPYPQNWTVYSSGGSFIAGLYVGSALLYVSVTPVSTQAPTVTPLFTSGAVFLYASTAGGNLVHTGAGAGSAGTATMQTGIRVDKVQALGTQDGEVGFLFLQTARNMTALGTSCYGLMWRPPSGLFALMKYRNGLVGSAGWAVNHATVLSITTFALAEGVSGTLRVSWSSSATGTQVIAYAQAGSSFVFGSSVLSHLDTSTPLTAASAITEGLGIRAGGAGMTVTFDQTTLSG